MIKQNGWEVSRAKSVASWATLESINGMPATSFGNFTLVWEEIVPFFASFFSKKIEVGKVVPRTAVPRRLPNSRRFIVEQLPVRCLLIAI
jgi:hypothetical protein